MNKKIPPKSKRLTPADYRRLGELQGRTLTQEEQREEDALFSRLVEWGAFRDMSGDAHRESDGYVSAGCTQRRLGRRLLAEGWLHQKQVKNLKRQALALSNGCNTYCRQSNMWLVQYRGKLFEHAANRASGFLVVQSIMKAAQEGKKLTSEDIFKMHPELIPQDASENADGLRLQDEEPEKQADNQDEPKETDADRENIERITPAQRVEILDSFRNADKKQRDEWNKVLRERGFEVSNGKLIRFMKYRRSTPLINDSDSDRKLKKRHNTIKQHVSRTIRMIDAALPGFRKVVKIESLKGEWLCTMTGGKWTF